MATAMTLQKGQTKRDGCRGFCRILLAQEEPILVATFMFALLTTFITLLNNTKHNTGVPRDTTVFGTEKMSQSKA